MAGAQAGGMPSRLQQALLFGLLTLLALALGLLLGGPLLLMSLGHTDTPARSPWPGPPGTRWEGTELRGMQRWDGYFSNVRLAGEYLELRCVARPALKTRLEYWPGASWEGWVEWRADKVVYVPRHGQTSRPRHAPASLPAPGWLKSCPR